MGRKAGHHSTDAGYTVPMRGYVAGGSNLGSRQVQLERGLHGLQRAGLVVRAVSSFWESPAAEGAEGGPFLNLVARVEGPTSADAWLEALMCVEHKAGRVRPRPGAARTLDLDLLLLGQRQIDRSDLQVPHPRMWDRHFVMAPLAELDPDLLVPGREITVGERAEQLLREAAIIAHSSGSFKAR